jgi:RNA polymerase sigma factor (sigma-70 family)
MKTDIDTNSWLSIVSPESTRETTTSAKECRKSNTRQSARPSLFNNAYLTRLRNGDEETAKHFNAYFRRMLRIKLWGKFGREWQEDIIDEVMAAAIQKILDGEPRDAACLPSYVRAICANIARKPRTQGVELNVDHLSDGEITMEERLLQNERARMVRDVLITLKSRDRNILVDLFYNDMARDEVCNKYGVTRERLRLILFRARARFQEKWANN